MKHLLLGFLFLISTLANAQELHSKSKRAIKYYNEGKAAYDLLYYSEAETSLIEAYKDDPKFLEAHLLLAELYKDQKRYTESQNAYLEVISIDPTFFVPAYFSLGEVYFFEGNYRYAQKNFKTFLAKSPTSEKLKDKATKYLAECKFALRAINKPVSFKPISMGDSINTKYDEYWPAISVDGKLFLFTRQIEATGDDYIGDIYQEDFFMSSKSNSTWSTAKSLGAPLNTVANEGALTLESGGQYMYFTACDRSDGHGSCDIYYSERSKTGWGAAKNAGTPLNSADWEAQPSLSSDGRSLFFASSRPGGLGGMDIWVSKLNNMNEWSEPVNLGDSINTAGDEMSPYIHFDGVSLYFSSNGRPSLGGFDIYMAKRLDDSKWVEVKNLGYPINTHSDEIGLVINSSGRKAYFSSEVSPEKGRDLFYFDLPEEVRPDPVSYVKGTVFDKKTGEKLQAKYEFTNLDNNEIVYEANADTNGEFLISLKPDGNYGLNVTHDKYLFYSDDFVLEGIHSDTLPFSIEVPLNRIKVGEKMTLKNILFETNSAVLHISSQVELAKLTNLMTSNPELKIEVRGHTDSVGSDYYNLNLSKQRAESVRTYLVLAGVNPKNITYSGFGERLPVADNITEDGRQQNRRTEIKILETGDE